MVLDYKKLDFKCGIEVHQQLEGKKLFCNCPTEIRKDNPDFTFDRRLRASAGESGKIDVAAVGEQAKKKLFTYWGYEDTTCLVEMDEEPPNALNPESLKTAIQVSKLLNCEITDKIQFMRKTVVDGSNTSGFQRTAIIGRKGFIEVNGKKIGISGVFLEEEACQIMERTKGHDTYNISRLGIPLLEIATDPDITNPEECKEVASKIGMILRSTGSCKRGIGSIRQDVNLSIKGGARVEIKGFQDLKSIPKVIENEVKRHRKLVAKGTKIQNEVRKAESNFSTSFLRPMPGASRMYPETDIPTIELTKELSSLKIPELIDKQLGNLEKKYSLSQEKIKSLIKQERLNLFEEVASKNKKIKPVFIVDTFLSYISELVKKHKGCDPFKIKDEHFKVIFENLDKGNISNNSIMDILADIASGKVFNIKKYELEDIDLDKEVKVIVDKNKGAPVGALMGIIMNKFQGKVDGKKVMELVKKYSLK